jgi:pimeloyl-ACP methyl ester carboxylesterase/DNA-binding winged helix-turn-helix (wHTH) protein/class 3 adenylate cyclase
LLRQGVEPEELDRGRSLKMPSKGQFSFDRFQLDLSTGRLSGPSGPIPLTPKALAVLEHLAQRPGRLIGKDELLAAIWPGVFLGEGVLKVCVSEIRSALGDQARNPRIIETAHRRGYRFIAEVVASPPRPAPVVEHPATSPLRPPVLYARSGDVNIAYQVVGTGPIDLVFALGWVSHLEYLWSEPSLARFLRRLAGFSRLILLDKRGSGLSDRTIGLPTLEERVEDVRAVLNAVGSPRAALLAVAEETPVCSSFAATYPERTEALVMIGAYARRPRTADYPWAPTQDEREAFCREILERWGGALGIEARAPSAAADPAFREWWAAYLRGGASPAAAVALTRMDAEIDVRRVLPTIRVPTLVLHRTGDRCVVVEEGRYVASLVPGARFVELPGDDHLPFVGDHSALLDEIERFLTVERARAESNRVLATILCATLSGRSGGPTAAEIARLQALVAAQTQRFRGRGLPGADGGVLSAFDGTARAIRCSRSIVDEGFRLGVTLGIGLHTGEWDRLQAVGQGPVAEAATRIAALARPGDVLVSRTVVDLVGGSGFQFSERGKRALAAGEEAQPFFAVR